jgi:hypothetical protein
MTALKNGHDGEMWVDDDALDADGGGGDIATLLSCNLSMLLNLQMRRLSKRLPTFAA